MKNFRFFAAFILSMIVGSAMAQQYMIVNLADGKSVIYNVEDVQTVTFLTDDEPVIPQVDWVDLGLPSGLQWASCNLGADALEGAGNYYQWGDVRPYEYLSAANKNYQGVSESTLEAEGVINDKGELTPAHDPVTLAYGEGYRMPNTQDLGELKDNCDWAWEEINGVKCVRFTSRVNGKSIVIPAVGLINGDNGSLDQYNELATFWTSTVSGSYCYDFYMTIPEKDNYGYNGGNFINLTSYRKHAHPVRGVRVKNAAPQLWQPTSVLGSCKLGDNLDVRGWVTAIDARGFILTDLSGSILCYQASGFDFNNVAIGDQITVSSEITQYNTGLQIAISDGSYNIGGNDAYQYPEAKVYTGAMMDEAVARSGEYTAEYVKFTGKCSVNGNYYNFAVEGAQTAQGSGYQVPQFIKDQLADGQTYDIYGYFASISSSRYFNVVITKVEKVDAPEPSDWKASSVLGTCQVGDNVEVKGWVTAIDNRGFILTDLSGSILCYQASGFDVASVAIGNRISISAEISQFNTGLQIAISDGSYAVEGTDSYTYPAPKVYTGAMMDEAVARKGEFLAEYVKFTGKCTINGNYINFVVEGAQTAQGSGYQVPASIKEQLTDGHEYEVIGYFASVSSSRYFNVVITEVKGNGTQEPQQPEEPKEWSLTSVLGSCKLGDKVDVCGWVTAIDNRGFVLTDGSGSILCYQASGFDVASVKIGDQISVSSEITSYGTALQIAISNGSYQVGANDAYTYPTPKAYTGAMMDEAVTRTDNYPAEYVKFVGTCSINGNYVNFIVDGAQTAQGSGYQVPQSVKDQLADGESYEIYGYFVSVSSSRYFNVVITDAK